MAEESAIKKFRAYLDSLVNEDREWFEERLAIIQFEGDSELSELEAARSAYNCFQIRKKRKAA